MPPRQFFPHGRPKKDKPDSDEKATTTEALYGLLRGSKAQTDQISAMIKRHDELIVWLQQYFENQASFTSQQTSSRPPAWVPQSKTQVTGIVALVILALTVLAIVLASCGVLHIPKKVQNEQICQPGDLCSQTAGNSMEKRKGVDKMRNLRNVRTPNRSGLVSMVGRRKGGAWFLQGGSISRKVADLPDANCLNGVLADSSRAGGRKPTGCSRGQQQRQQRQLRQCRHSRHFRHGHRYRYGHRRLPLAVQTEALWGQCPICLLGPMG